MMVLVKYKTNSSSGTIDIQPGWVVYKLDVTQFEFQQYLLNTNEIA